MYLSSTVLCGALRGRELSPSLGAPLARVAVVECALTHLVGLACDGWVNCVRRALRRRVLSQRLVAGLTSTGSEQMFS